MGVVCQRKSRECCKGQTAEIYRQSTTRSVFAPILPPFSPWESDLSPMQVDKSYVGDTMRSALRWSTCLDFGASVHDPGLDFRKALEICGFCVSSSLHEHTVNGVEHAGERRAAEGAPTVRPTNLGDI